MFQSSFYSFLSYLSVRRKHIWMDMDIPSQLQIEKSTHYRVMQR
uniref:Uncharacterized protein n=1 Tax=Anguilla anguilla TaxID=7936 RepID=A0A0E9T5C5_ANGAN